MKRTIAIILSLVMMSLSATALAVSSSFVSSPSENKAPEIMEFKPSDEECEADLVITPYNEKEELPEVLETMIETAREQITKSNDLTNLNSELKKIAENKKIDGKKLAVSDLFDIHATGCDFHDGHLDFDIILKADTLKRFVGLLHMKKDKEWELVSDAEITENGTHLKFSVDSFSPFAIVVETEGKTDSDSPATGYDAMIPLCVGVMVVSAAVATILIIKGKKKEA